MTHPLDRPATADGLFLWVMHRFAEAFEEHAVLKGGLALRLLDSPRFTTDIDYAFTPFRSKIDVVPRVEALLRAIEGGILDTSIHSKMFRTILRVDDVAIQIEVSVTQSCRSIPMATGGFARSLGHPSQIVRVLDPSQALSHKLGAWNERRLVRDLYDVYFLSSRVGATPDLEILEARLARVESRLPRLQSRRHFTRTELATELREYVIAMTEDQLREDLVGLLPPEELAGLGIRLAASVRTLADRFLDQE